MIQLPLINGYVLGRVHLSVRPCLCVMLMILPLFGMLFFMRFVPAPLLPLSESSLKPTQLISYTKAYMRLSLNHPLAFSVKTQPLFLSLDIEIG